MTRINVVPVELLSNQHCMAEYKEITRPFNKVEKRLDKGTMSDLVIPSSYVLGKGHETFFFNKLGWLLARYQLLFIELQKRGFNLDADKFHEIHSKFQARFSTTPWFGDYTPDHNAVYLNMARLAKRSNMTNVLNELGE